MLYISTDYVFDGTKPPYSAEDEPNPLNSYGQTKLDGEKVTLEASAGKWCATFHFLVISDSDL